MTVPDFLAITGATATGKTALSLSLADALDGEIISMDSRQIYRGMDVGTDKVGAVGRRRVPHFGIDIRNPDERYSAGEFARNARRWIREIRGRAKLPVLAGGTGFFLKALMEPLFSEPPLDRARVLRLRRYLSGRGLRELERWVRALDPERTDIAAAGGRRRMGRTLEIALLTGRPLSWWHRIEPAVVPPEGMVVVLEICRDELYRRINARVRTMAERGMAAEVRALRAEGYNADDPGMSATGYREFLAYVEGRSSLEEALDATRRATRRYARRQLTWFRNQLPGSALRIDATRPVQLQCAEVVRAWRARREDGRPVRDPPGGRTGPGDGP